MATFSIPMVAPNPLDALTELYFRPLADLAAPVKKHLIARLQESLHAKTLPPTYVPDILSFCGAWDDEGDVDEFVREIYESRTSAPQRAFFE